MRLRLPIAIVLTLAAASAQSPVRKFEVASVKRCRDTDRVSGGARSPGSIHLNCLTAANLIRMAYLIYPTGRANVPVSPTVFQTPISGGPSWIDSERFRIDAKADAPEIPETMQGPMLQSLLEERFRLKLHHETRETNVFELTVAKGGARLPSAKAGGCVPMDRDHLSPPAAPGQPGPAYCGAIRWFANSGTDVPGATMADLCRGLTAFVDRDIVDKTGIAGVFDIRLELTPGDLGYERASPDPTSNFTPGDGRAIAAALEKIGLHMRPAKGAMQILVVDHVEQPLENQ
jgi:uncharacterized protein (TIGR03435 family)